MTVPVTSRTPGSSIDRRAHLVGSALALIAAVHQGVIASLPTNDDFTHRVLARAVLAGDWPVRDFFDSGLGLMFGLSAIAEAVVGYRLLAEAVLVGGMWAVSAYLVFRLVRQLTGSTAAAALSTILLIVAGPRSYSYPKVVVYAAAATLWWAYVRKPGPARAMILGAWTAAAFYWRPDHGVYVAAGTVLAIAAAHRFRLATLVRCCQAGATTLALVAPFLVFVATTVGLREYVESGLVLADAQHTKMDTHEWPKWPISSAADVIRLDPREEYAPTIGLRWTADSALEARDEVVRRHALTPVSTEGLTTRVRLSDASPPAIRDLVNEPIVEDTAGVERATSSLPWATWPIWQRWRFAHWWLRFRVFTGVDQFANAGEAVAMVFYVLPLVALIVAVPLLRKHLPGIDSGVPLVAFALFGVVTDIGLMRTPYDVRAVDGVVLPAILFGCCVAALWRAALAAGGVRRWLTAAATFAAVLLVVKSVAVAGQFGDRVGWLAGDWRSLARMRGAWAEARDRLVAEPPLTYWDGRRSPVSVRLARYARECVPPSERLLVLWFAPEIYYYADRLMAPRHVVFVQGYQELDQEQRMTLAKIKRYSPPIALANATLDEFTKDVFPGVVEYVHREYEVEGSFEENGDRYVILARRDRSRVRVYGEERWPCYR